MMSCLALYTLGSPQARLADQPLIFKERKALALLIYLAVTGETHQRETLGTFFWPELSPERSRANLRRTLWVIKQIIGIDIVG